VLFDETSGDTHLVGPDLIDAFSRLDPSLASRLAIHGSPLPEAKEEAPPQDELLLAGLLRLGLIEPANR
jgi:hypothetical protein